MVLMMSQFISVSGIDGAGKSTQVSNLARYLEQIGETPITMWSRGGYTGGFSALKTLARRFKPGLIPPPGKSPQREVMLHRSWVRRIWLTLALVDLMCIYASQIRWWQLRGYTVICDRYLWDTLIDFRLSFPGENVEAWWLWRLLVWVSPQPDAAFLLTIPVEESLHRSKEKGDAFSEPEEKIRQRYVQYEQLKQKGYWPVIIDATQPTAEVWAEIQEAVLKYSGSAERAS